MARRSAEPLKQIPFNRHSTNHTLAGKETEYGDQTFRSRLEARWAIVFDTLGIEWEYEPQHYRTPYGGYLLDFKVTPKLRTPSLIEVKGPEPVAIDYVRAQNVFYQTGIKIRFLVGGFPSFAPGSVRTFTDHPYPHFARAKWDFGASQEDMDRAVLIARKATWTDRGVYQPYNVDEGVWG